MSGKFNPATDLDLDALFDEFKSIIGDSAKELLEGAAEDVDKFVARIGSVMVSAVAAGDDAMVDEMKGALETLAERNRIRASREAMETLKGVIDIAKRGALAGISALAGGLF